MKKLISAKVLKYFFIVISLTCSVSTVQAETIAEVLDNPKTTVQRALQVVDASVSLKTPKDPKLPPIFENGKYYSSPSANIINLFCEGGKTKKGDGWLWNDNLYTQCKAYETAAEAEESALSYYYNALVFTYDENNITPGSGPVKSWQTGSAEVMRGEKKRILEVLHKKKTDARANIDLGKTADDAQTALDLATKALTDSGCPSVEPADVNLDKPTVSGTKTCKELRADKDAAAGVLESAEKKLDEETNNSKDKCSAWPGTWFTYCLYDGLTWLVSSFVVATGGTIVYFAGIFFDYSLWFGVTNFSNVLGATGADASKPGSGGAIYQTWVLIRNLFNIIIVFQLLRLAITKIVGSIVSSVDTSSRAMRQKLVSVIIFTLFVNFSFFFTKSAIDLSNIATLQFYAGLGATGASEGASTFDRGNVGIAIIEGLGIRSNIFYSENTSELSDRDVRGVTSEEGGAVDQFTDSIFGNILLFGLLLLAAFILLQGASIFIGRAVFLILLVILSPLMFAGGIVGFVDKWSATWKKYLLEQLFVAPLYMAMLFIVLKLAGTRQNPGLLSIFNAEGTGVAGFFGEMALMLVQAAIMAGLFVACVTIAKKFAGDSASRSMAFGNKVFGSGIGKAGRLTAGRLANRISNSDRLKGWSGKGGVRGAIADRGILLADKGKNATFDYRNSKTLARTGSITGTKFDTGNGYNKGYVGERAETDKKKADALAAREGRLTVDTYGLEGDEKKKVEATNKKRQAEYAALTSINRSTTDAQLEKLKANLDGLEGDELIAAKKFNDELEAKRVSVQSGAKILGVNVPTSLDGAYDAASGVARSVTGVRQSSTIARSQAENARKALHTEDRKKKDEKRRKQNYEDFVNEYETDAQGNHVTEMVDGKEVKKVLRVREPEEAKEYWNEKKQEMQQERADLWKKIDKFRNPSITENGVRMIETANGGTASISDADYRSHTEKIKKLDKELAKMGDINKNIDSGSKEFGIYKES